MRRPNVKLPVISWPFPCTRCIRLSRYQRSANDICTSARGTGDRGLRGEGKCSNNLSGRALITTGTLVARRRDIIVKIASALWLCGTTSTSKEACLVITGQS